MARIRTFIAIEISPEVRARAANLMQQLRASQAQASWTRPDNLHLTLKFLGDTPDTELPAVCRAVQQAVRDQPPFHVSFRRAGAFPRTAQPRTVWIGVERGLEELRQLQQQIESRLYEEGFQRERRKFFPHLTIGRVRGGGATQAALGQLLEAHAAYEGGEVIVEEVVVFASYPAPEGTTYQALDHAELRG
jgi:2'-5' RNA ligase